MKKPLSTILVSLIIALLLSAQTFANEGKLTCVPERFNVEIGGMDVIGPQYINISIGSASLTGQRITAFLTTYHDCAISITLDCYENGRYLTTFSDSKYGSDLFINEAFVLRPGNNYRVVVKFQANSEVVYKYLNLDY